MYSRILLFSALLSFILFCIYFSSSLCLYFILKKKKIELNEVLITVVVAAIIAAGCE